MDQSDVSREIVNSTHRILEQIKALEVCPNTPNGNNYRQIGINGNQKPSSDVLDLISSLQTDQSEEILKDVHNWSDSRVHTYETYEKPLLDQMEINQKADSNLADEFSPRLEVNINNFDNKLTNAKEAVATLAESLIRQRCIDTGETNNNSNELSSDCGGYSSNILQFQSTDSNTQQASDDQMVDYDYEQMRLREAHLVQIVGELSNEVESMSHEAVSKNLEILNMQHEAEQRDKELQDALTNNKQKEELIISFSNRIEELEQQLEAEKKRNEQILSDLNEGQNGEYLKPQYFEVSSQTNIDAFEKDTSNESIPTFRIIDNFSFDIECDENISHDQSKNQILYNPSIRTIDNFSLDIECDEEFNQNQKEKETKTTSTQTTNTELNNINKVGEQNSTPENENNDIKNRHLIGIKPTPATEFESLLRMETEEFPNSSGHSSVLPLGIKQRQISTGNGKRRDCCTFRLFFKDKDGGAVIVDADVARRDEKTGVMLLKPSDVRTTSSPSKTSRISLFDASVELHDSTSNSNQNNNIDQTNPKPETKTTIKSSNLNVQTLSNTSNSTQNKNEDLAIKDDQNAQNSTQSNNQNNNNQNTQNLTQNGSSCNPKPLTKHQLIMKRILEIHERQLAKIKAARVAAAASYYYAPRPIKMQPNSLAGVRIEEATVINLNKSVERQIKFDQNGNGLWSNFSSRPSYEKLPTAIVGAPISIPKYSNFGVQQNPRIVPRKNRKVVVPAAQKSKMKSPRRPFIL